MSNQLSDSQKQSLYSAAQNHVKDLAKELKYQSEQLLERSRGYRENLKEFADIDIDDAASDSAEKELAIAKVQLLERMSKDMLRIKSSPYFIRIDVTWTDTDENETLYFGKDLYKDANIFSWVSPISTLRYAEIGNADYDRPDGTKRKAVVHRKDNFLITNAEIVFMTHEDSEYDRQVVFQKHLNERKEFLLPEIVAELDRLQDEIIRSDPNGYFLISGPAGSGKTTLALHRVAYLVLTPEFKEEFPPERIIVFVSNQSDIDYFSKLLPELGIEGVRITTFGEWATLAVNSRYTKKTSERFKFMPLGEAVEFASNLTTKSNLPARLFLDEFRKYKQELIERLQIKEKKAKDVYPILHNWYLSVVDSMPMDFVQSFKSYLDFQKKNRYLDETDLIILIKSLETPPKQYAHLVIDEVQNWSPAQLDIATSIATRNHKSITFIGDIRQKTKAFSIQDWSEISQEFLQDGPRAAELLKVYRNSRPILEHLGSKGYDVNTDTTKVEGSVSQEQFTDLEQMQSRVKLLLSDALDTKTKQVGVLSRFQHSIDRLEYLGHGDSNLHILTVEEAQGLEFDTVIILDSQDFEIDYEKDEYEISHTSKKAYTEQGRYLYYVATTRAKTDLILMSR